MWEISRPTQTDSKPLGPRLSRAKENEVPEDGVDTSRLPVKKDLRKAQRAPKKKETLSVKKKNKQKQ